MKTYRVITKPGDESAFDSLRHFDYVAEPVETTTTYEVYLLTVERDVDRLLDASDGVISYEVISEEE